MADPAATDKPPSSVLIIGSGVFGLTTAYELALRPRYASTKITVLDRSPVPGPSEDAASVDSSRIIRADYADPAYARLAAEAQTEWRKTSSPSDLGGEGRYRQSGLCLVAGPIPASASSPAASATNTLVNKTPKKSSLEYVRESYHNVVSLAGPEGRNIIRELPNPSAIKEHLGTPIAPGTWGYHNPLAGWADAAAAMSYLTRRVQALNRVSFVSGTAARINYSHSPSSPSSSSDVIAVGATLQDGAVLSADLVIVAAGAWTGQLVDLSRQAIATGQVLGYLDITPDELAVLSKMPVTLNFTTGLFMIPPSGLQLKVARHAYGYLNPTTIPSPSPPSASTSSTSSSSSLSSSSSSSSSTSSTLKTTKPNQKRTTISFPATHLTNPTLKIPEEGERALRQALRTIVPIPAIHDRPFVKTRLCWYTDTPSGDFLVSRHPDVRNLFVATGGSGHGFKFLPVLGREIVNILEGSGDPVLTEKWRWRRGRGEEAQRHRDATNLYGHIITEDGSRGGVPGILLKPAQAKL